MSQLSPAEMEKQIEQRGCGTSVIPQDQTTMQKSPMVTKRSAGKKRHSILCHGANYIKRLRHKRPESDDKLNESGSIAVTRKVGVLGNGHTCDLDLLKTSTVDCHKLHIDSLPQSILLHTFKYLSLYDLLRRVCLVSKHWRDMGHDPDLWRVINLKGQNKVTDDIIKRLTGYSHNVLSVDVTDSRLVTNEGISLVARQCTQLRVLKLIRYSEPFTYTLELYRSMPCLQMHSCTNPF